MKHAVRGKGRVHTGDRAMEVWETMLEAVDVNSHGTLDFQIVLNTVELSAEK